MIDMIAFSNFPKKVWQKCPMIILKLKIFTIKRDAVHHLDKTN